MSWVRQPDRRHGNLALALGSLAILILVSPLLGGTGATAQLLTDLALVMFLISGYGLLMFRDSFVPFRPRTNLLITAGIVAIGLLGIVLELPANPEAQHSALQSLVLVAVLGVWAFCILEPIVTFWMAAHGRPAVEKARLRAISIGYAGLLLVVVVGTIAGALNTFLSLLVSLAALAIVPILYVAFFPPVWLRRIWRQPDEAEFRHALHDLLLYSPDRAALADRALAWAERRVGGDSAFVLDSDGSVLAVRGLSARDPNALGNRPAFLQPEGKPAGHAPWQAGTALVIPRAIRQRRC